MIPLEKPLYYHEEHYARLMVVQQDDYNPCRTFRSTTYEDEYFGHENGYYYRISPMTGDGQGYTLAVLRGDTIRKAGSFNRLEQAKAEVDRLRATASTTRPSIAA